ncbi:hypothetical protein LDENG_00268000 [Lucifuga dentata]|nr:hypothetical protein LDENG_00268000 [Lucifuga dentata]
MSMERSIYAVAPGAWSMFRPGGLCVPVEQSICCHVDYFKPAQLSLRTAHPNNFTAHLWVLSNKPVEYQLHTVLSCRDVGATDRDFWLYRSDYS